MDIKLINPFLEATTSVMPSLGFKEIVRSSLSVGENYLNSQGVTVLIGITHEVQGNIAYNMTEETAKKIASTMMMGMPVPEFDAIAQSAISELVNMITGNAAANFEKVGVKVDISPPSLITGENFKTRVSTGKFLVLDLLVDGSPLQINIGIEQIN